MSLSKKISSFNEIDKAKGEAFEQYVRYIFPKEKFIKLSQTHSYNTDKDDYTEKDFEQKKWKVFFYM